MYVPYTGPETVEESEEYLEKFKNQINGIEKLKTKGGILTSIKIVKKLPFYGYHPKPERFIKVQVY